jgi:proteasome lid subunit RPN8/RPN11
MMAWLRGRKRARRRERPASPKLMLSTFKAELKAVCRKTVYPHVFNNANREVGGVLVGRKMVTGNLPKVYGAIEAISADEQRATLTFTQESWEHVHRVMASDFERGEIVGWYHSHPGFGIFLSDHDLFIHNNFFGDHSQVALVVDPHAGTQGVFTWQDGKVAKLYVEDTPSGWGPVDLSKLEGTHSPGRRRDLTGRKRPGRYATLALALVAGIIGGVALWGLFGSNDQSPSTPEPSGQQAAPAGEASPGTTTTGSAGAESQEEVTEAIDSEGAPADPSAAEDAAPATSEPGLAPGGP